MASVNRFRGTPRATVNERIRHVATIRLPAGEPGSQAGPTLSFSSSSELTPLGLQKGDLVVAFLFYRTNAVNWSVLSPAGQNWVPCGTHRGALHTVQAFYCNFNGVWNPTQLQFSIGSGTDNATCVLHAFRGTGRDTRWALDQPPLLGSGAGPGFTITGTTPQHSRTVAISCVASQDDNDYTLTTPGGWSVLGTKQNRNQSGSDSSMAFAMLAQNQPLPTGNHTQTQGSFAGTDAGITMLLVFKEGQDFITGRSQISRAPSRKAPGKRMFVGKLLAITEQQTNASIGDLNVSLDSVTLSAAAKIAITGTLSSTLGNVTLASTGALALKGNLSATLGDVTLAATGSSAVSGTLAVTLADVTLASNGTLRIAATLASTLGAATLSSAAVLALKGNLSATLGAVTLAATGSSALAGNLSATLGAVTLSSTATLPLRASLAVTLGQVVLDAQGVGPGSSVSSGGSGSWRRRRRMSR